jgi:hypothetical protein
VWPISEVATRLVEVRSLGHSGPDLLTLSSSHFDPKLTIDFECHISARHLVELDQVKKASVRRVDEVKTYAFG